MAEDKSFAQRLSQARAGKQWSQEQLSKATGIAQTQLSRYKQGVVPRVQTLGKLAQALDCSMIWLRDGTVDQTDADTMLVPSIWFEELPKYLQNALIQSAKKNNRSVKQEMLDRLTASFFQGGSDAR